LRVKIEKATEIIKNHLKEIRPIKIKEEKHQIFNSLKKNIAKIELPAYDEILKEQRSNRCSQFPWFFLLKAIFTQLSINFLMLLFDMFDVDPILTKGNI